MCWNSKISNNDCIRYVAYLQTYANDESRLDVTNATRFGVLALKFFQVEFFQVFWCYMRIAYLSAGLLKVLQVVYGDLRYVTSLEKIQTQNTFEIFLKQTAEDVPFHKFSLYLNSRILEFILTSRTYMHKNFKTRFPSHLPYLSIWRCQSKDISLKIHPD